MLKYLPALLACFTLSLGASATPIPADVIEVGELMFMAGGVSAAVSAYLLKRPGSVAKILKSADQLAAIEESIQRVKNMGEIGEDLKKTMLSDLVSERHKIINHSLEYGLHPGKLDSMTLEEFADVKVKINRQVNRIKRANTVKGRALLGGLVLMVGGVLIIALSPTFGDYVSVAPVDENTRVKLAAAGIDMDELIAHTVVAAASKRQLLDAM